MLSRALPSPSLLLLVALAPVGVVPPGLLPGDLQRLCLFLSWPAFCPFAVAVWPASCPFAVAFAVVM